MKNNIICGLTAILLVTICSFSLMWWWTAVPERAYEARLPIPIPKSLLSSVKINIEGLFKKFTGTPSEITTGWPRFRGSNYDNVNTETVPLLDSWPTSGPPKLWSIDIGEGYAGPAVLNGRVYLLDYDKKEGADSLRCFSLDDGKEIWRRWYKVKVKRNHGMSRTVPAVTDKYVVTIGPKCQVMCADAITGSYIWGIDLPFEYDTKVPLWYTGQCPLIDGNTAVIATGGKALLIGVDLPSGKVVWTTPNPNTHQMSHSSIMPMTLLDKKMYIYCAAGAMVGISAEEGDKGTLLWETTDWKPAVMSPSPVKLDDKRIFITAGYGEGSMILQLSRENDKFTIAPLQTIPRSRFACEQHTPILYKKHLFSILPGDAGALKKQAVCMTTDGIHVWNSGKKNRFGIGPFLIADDKILILNDDGELTMAKASTTEYKELAHARVLEGHDSWGPMALVEGKLLLRDFNKMICLDLRVGNRKNKK